MVMVFAGPVTSITLLQPPLHLKRSTEFQTDTNASADDTWQMLTGHDSGEVKVWQQSGGSPLQPLLVLASLNHSPVRSLVVMDQVLCCAHADGQLTLYIMQSELQAAAPEADQNSLPALALPHAVFQAHFQGLSQCVKCVVGLMSVGVSGTILMWSEDQVKSLLHQGAVHAEAR